MTTRRARALLLATWTLGGCNVLVGLDDVNILQTGAGGAGATTAGSGAAPGGTAQGGDGAATPAGGDPAGGGAGGTGGDTTTSSTGTGGDTTTSSTGTGGDATTSSTGTGGDTTTSSGSGGGTPCGDGVITDGEQCDDGDPTGGDGCSADCQVELSHQCSVPGPSVCVPQETLCADGADSDGDGLIDFADPDCALPAYWPSIPCQSIRIYRSVNVPLSIPDGGAGSAASPIFVPDGFAVAHTAVLLDITHPRVGDLQATLLPPFGPPRTLTAGNGGNGSNYMGTLFDQVCNTSVMIGFAPFNGCFEPESYLPANGQPAAGSWTLDVEDFAPGQNGTLNGWTLILCAE